MFNPVHLVIRELRNCYSERVYRSVCRLGWLYTSTIQVYVPRSMQKEMHTFRYIRHAIKHHVINLHERWHVYTWIRRARSRIKHSNYNFNDLETARYATRSSGYLSYYYEDVSRLSDACNYVFTACIAMWGN